MDLSISSAEERGERPGAPAGESPPQENSAPAPHAPRHRGMPAAGPAINPALVFRGIIAVAVVLGLLLLVWVAKAIWGGGAADRVPAAPAAAVAPAPEPVLTVIATEPVRVKVARQSDGRELFQGTMEANERRDFPSVPLWITATALESIRLEVKGKQFMIQKKGYDRVSVDASQFAH
jgi:hypothetical protein